MQPSQKINTKFYQQKNQKQLTHKPRLQFKCRPYQKQQESQEIAGQMTSRINQLIKMRHKHQQIITKLTVPKTIQKDKQTTQNSTQIKKKYMNVIDQYILSTKSQQNQRYCQSHSQQKNIQPAKKALFKQKSDTQKLQTISRTFSLQDSVDKIQNANKLSIQLSTSTSNDPFRKVRYQQRKYACCENCLQSISQCNCHIQQESNSHKSKAQNIPFQQQLIQKKLNHYSICQQQQQSELQQQQDFDMHVNLMASLSLFDNTDIKTSQICKKNGVLSKSIKEYFSKNQLTKYFNIKLVYIGQQGQNTFKNENVQKKLKIQNLDFIQIIKYLDDGELWQGLFKSQILQSQTEGLSQIKQFWGLCFQSQKGQYNEPFLSENPLTQNQKKLLVLKGLNTNQNEKYQRNKQLKVDVTFILLFRLLRLETRSLNFPQMLHRLFGFGIRLFKTQSLSEYLSMSQSIDLLRQIHQKQVVIGNNKGNNAQSSNVSQNKLISYAFEIYGFNKKKSSYEPIDLAPTSFQGKNAQQISNKKLKIYQFRDLLKQQKNLKIFSQKYSQIAMVNQQELPVKSIRLKHNHNHFVVVSLLIVEEGLHFFTIQINQSKQTSYRVCLLSQKRQILQCKVVKSSQNFALYLLQYEHELYISKIEQQQLNIQQNKNGFTLYVQSHHLISKHDIAIEKDRQQFQLQLRMKQEYQNYTQIIIEQYVALSYLEKHIIQFFNSRYRRNCQIKNYPIQSLNESLSQNQDNFIQLLQQNLTKYISPSEDIMVYRVHIKSLDLYVDAVNNQSENLVITYAQSSTLCDKNYKKNQVYLNKNRINLIYLTKNSAIKQICLIKQQKQFKNEQKYRQVQGLLPHKIIVQEW